MTSVVLGLRLAVRARPSRSALIVLGSALATALLLTTAGAYEHGISTEPPLTPDEQRLLFTIVVAVACPIVVLLLTAARLSSASREARTAALSRLGVSRNRLRIIAASENALLAAVGAAVGVALHLGAAAPGFAALTRGLGWFGGVDPQASPFGTFVVVAGVVVASALAGFAPGRAARSGTRPDARTSRPRWWRLLPIAVGLGALSAAVISARDTPDASPTSGEFALFFGGGALATLGLPFALPVAVRLIGDLTARAPSPSVAIAGRGLQDEPAAITRLVAAVLAAIVVVTGALCVLQAFWDSPQVERALLADTTGPQYGTISPGPEQPAPSPSVADELAAVPGVRAAVYVPDVFIEGAPGACDDFSDASAICGNALVGTCADLAQLAELAGHPDGCRDDAVARITTRYDEDGSAGRWDAAAPTWIRPSSYASDFAPDPASVAVELPPVTGTIHLPGHLADSLRSYSFQVFVPVALAAEADLSRGHIELILDGGSAGRDAISAEARRLGLYFDSELLDSLRAVQGYEAMVWAVGGVMVATGLAGLAIAGADRATERRRRIAGLWAIGTPFGVLRRSQLLRSLLPLAIGAPLAVVVGAIVGASYLSLVGVDRSVPWASAGTLLVITLVAAALTSVLTLTGLGSRPSPDLLRRE